MGVKKAQDAPIATVIKNGSVFTPKEIAIPTDIGAIISAVAALFIISERHIVIIIIRARIKPGDIPEVTLTILFASSRVVPVVCRASLIGIIDPNNTTTGQSMLLYTSRAGNIPL